ncbi:MULTISPECIES: hypothetical protein [unclassified Vibrio]|uniref:Uncharacterized protein n=1 Tax=Vibrio sp. HB236076 TaxID=3232307 RepID=A0AB39HBN1_9VIBR|nr:hypothetical protein [Vibrio sp. HB161653]MDP5253385.1 hypothetical protein [Vibrio sp. HB161653]
MNKDSSQQAYSLIKFFTEEEHYKSFLEGTNLFRTPHYYRKCEDTGRGDRHESCIYNWDENTGRPKPKFNHPDIKDSFKSVLIYPANEQKDSWIQSWAIIGNVNGFENSFEQLQEEFGRFFVLLPFNKIEAYKRLLEKASGLKVNCCALGYSDDPTKRSLTVKDSKFSYQKEFRFFIGECGKDELKDKWLETPKIKKLLMDAKSIKLTSPNGVIRYYTVGGSKVVTSIPTYAKHLTQGKM